MYSKFKKKVLVLVLSLRLQFPMRLILTKSPQISGQNKS